MKTTKKPQRYKCKCPKCSERFDVQKSILMQMGINTGSCNCPKCKTLLHLEVIKGTFKMDTQEYSKYVEKRNSNISKEKSNE